jgi:PilZ domain-containing protein
MKFGPVNQNRSMCVDIRTYPRIATNIPVEWKAKNSFRRGRAFNLGGGGMFLVASEAAEAESELEVRFRPKRGVPPARAQVVVRHHENSRGLGLEFTDIPPEFHQEILRLIIRRLISAGNPARPRLVTQVERDGQEFLANSLALTAAGMFIETKENLRVGSQFKVRFRLGDDGPLIATQAEALYSLEDIGAGVKFSGLSESDLANLEKFLVSENQRENWPFPPRDSFSS